MPEPVTTGAMVIGALAWTGLAAVSGAIGGKTDRTVCDVLRRLKDRAAGLWAMPENDDVARAVRTAQLQALERLIRDYRAVGRPEWQTEPHTRPDMFFQRSLAFCVDAIGRSRDLTVKLNFE